jgi:hypothetical protein
MLVRLVLLALLIASAPAQQKPSALFQEVDEMTSSLSEITGWPVKRKVPAKIITKDEFRHQVESRMKGASTNKEVHAEEVRLKMFGFISQDFDLAKETVDLVSEQAAAFYDYSKKRLFVLDSTAEGTEQRVALVHELAHALADQQHPLGKYLKKDSPDDDASSAREAVMEGQATCFQRDDREADRQFRHRWLRFSGVRERASLSARIARISLRRRDEIPGRRV